MRKKGMHTLRGITLLLILAWESLQFAESGELYQVKNKAKAPGKLLETIGNVYLITECVLLCKRTSDCQYSSLHKNNCSLYSNDKAEKEGNLTNAEEIQGKKTEECKNVIVKADDSDNLQADCSLVSRDCVDLYHQGVQNSGVYRLTDGTSILCDQKTDGGGWTVILARYKPFDKRDFKRTWQDYKHGFGDMNDEFWYGNAKLYELTNLKEHPEASTLLTEIDTSTFKFKEFSITDESDNYRLKISNQLGRTATDAHTNTWYALNGVAFSTYDKGNASACAISTKAGWWWESTNCHRYAVSFTRTRRTRKSRNLSCGRYYTSASSTSPSRKYGNEKGLLKVRRNSF